MEHIKIEKFSTQKTQIEISEIKDFAMLYQNNKEQISETLIHCISDSNYNRSIYWIFKSNDIFYLINIYGLKYKNIDDYIDAKSKGFESEYDAYYKAIQSGNWERYFAINFKGFDSLEAYNEAKNYGFLSPKDFKDFITKKFTDKQQYEEALKKEFPDAITYNEALSKGFENSNFKEYSNALNKGFENFSDFNLAKEKKIETDFELKLFQFEIKLKKDNLINSEFSSNDEVLIFKLLFEKEENEEINILDLYKKIQNTEKNAFDNKIPNSYNKKIKNEDDLLEIFINSKNINELGKYNSKTKIFKINTRIPKQDIWIIIDGSNVAWNGRNSANNEKADVKFIELMIAELKKIGFKNIKTFVDKSLSHHVNEKSKLNKLLSNKTIQVCPANTNADEFIIENAKKLNALIITNDKFEDHKQKDSWLSANYNSIRTSFQIINNEVTLVGSILKYK